MPLPGQVREADLSDQYEAACESACSEAESAAAEALDLPLPSYFRSRSHSYLRAIQAGCSQEEEDSVSLQSLSPPPSTGSLSNSRTLPSEYPAWGGALLGLLHGSPPGPCPSGPACGGCREDSTVEGELGTKARGLGAELPSSWQNWSSPGVTEADAPIVGRGRRGCGQELVGALVAPWLNTATAHRRAP